MIRIRMNYYCCKFEIIWKMDFQKFIEFNKKMNPYNIFYV